jgi:hypothetical protein
VRKSQSSRVAQMMPSTPRPMGKAST